MSADDELLKQFFREYAQPPIPDNGFSEQVSRRIAETPQPDIVPIRRINLIWTTVCVVVGLVWLFESGMTGILREGFHLGLGSWWHTVSSFDLKLSTLETTVIGFLTLLYSMLYALIDDARMERHLY